MSNSTKTSAVVNFQNIGKSYGTQSVLEDISLSVNGGELLCLLGPSGCGKTTTLRILAGLAEPTSGRVFLGGKDITHMPTYARDIGLVFQNYALFPHMTVSQNVDYGLKNIGISKEERARIVSEMLTRVELQHLAGRYPSALSGGQQQRAALARALSLKPKVLLLDEPFSNLDAQLRVRLRESLHSLVKSLDMTTVFVTHDQEEALMLADRIVVMNGGHIEQIGKPEDIYHRPATRFVAEFIGSCVVLDGTFLGDRFISAGGLEIAVEPGEEGKGSLVVRPENIKLSPDGTHEAIVDSSIYRGALTNIRLRAGQDVLLMEAHFSPGQQPQAGDRIRFSFDQADLHRVN